VGTFGQKFREERERRGFTLDDVSGVTKIGSRMLQAIEQEQFSVLPGGVFNKGFVRAYAKHLGFNPEQSVAEYLAALRQAQLDEQTAAWDQPLPSAPPPALQQKPSPQPSSDQRSTLRESPLPQALLQPPPHSPLPLWVSPKSSALKERSSKERSPQQRSSEERAIPPRPLERRYSQPIPLETRSLETKSHEPGSPDHGSLEQSPPDQITSQQNAAKQNPLEERPSEVKASEKNTLEEMPLAQRQIPEKSLPPATLVEVTPHLPHPKPAVPQILVADPPRPAAPTPRPISQKTPVAAPVTRITLTPTSWKAPALILILAAIVIAALLSSRHSKPAATSATAPANTSQTQSPATTINPAPSNVSTTPKAAAPSAPVTSTKVSSARTQKVQAAKLPPPFRLSIRASQNCFVSITADGELVARENLIAPANTSVKATHEIIVQVSNPAALAFRIDDHSISAPTSQTEAAKTYIFNSTGLKTSTK
jgi:transcriptional regulator with XRE-family HTH domain